MMNNNEMESFLKRLYNLYKNNIKYIDKDVFYSVVVHDQTKSRKISHFFDGWIERFKNNVNTKVFVDRDWKYFCQFINGVSHYDKNLIKLYIPLNADFIQEGANIIFDFLSQNDIKHLSKIGSHERNDDVVVRVNSIKDAKKVIEFVKKNELLQKNLLPTNPFILNQDGVGLVLDGDLSYNTELSNAIKMYFDNLIYNGEKKEPTARDFANFLIPLMNETKNRDRQLIYRQINMKAVKNIYSFDDFVNITNEYQKNNNLLLEALLTTKNKYGEHHMVTALLELLKGNANYITDDNKMRTKIIKYLNLDQIRRIINNLTGYNKNKDINNEVLINFIAKIGEYEKNKKNGCLNAIRYAIMQTAMKYKFENDLKGIYDLIVGFIETGDFRVFTSDNGGRDGVKEAFKNSQNILEKIKKDLKLDDSSSIEDVVNIIMKTNEEENTKRRKG